MEFLDVVEQTPWRLVVCVETGPSDWSGLTPTKQQFIIQGHTNSEDLPQTQKYLRHKEVKVYLYLIAPGSRS